MISAILSKTRTWRCAHEKPSCHPQKIRTFGYPVFLGEKSCNSFPRELRTLSKKNAGRTMIPVVLSKARAVAIRPRKPSCHPIFFGKNGKTADSLSICPGTRCFPKWKEILKRISPADGWGKEPFSPFSADGMVFYNIFYYSVYAARHSTC